MLVVIGIIAILSTGISMLNMKDSTQPIYAANRTMMTAFHEARINAVKRQADTRVIIYRGKDIARKFRQVGVIYKVKDADGLEKGWVALNRGVMLRQSPQRRQRIRRFQEHVQQRLHGRLQPRRH